MKSKNISNVYSAKTVAFLYRYLITSHYDCSNLLAGTELNASVIDNPEGTITMNQKKQITKNIISITKDPLIGLKMGMAFRLDDFGTLGYAALCAKTREESLKILLSLQLLIMTEFEISTDLKEEQFSIHFFSSHKDIDDAFIYYCDIETAAVVFSDGNSEENKRALISIKLMHNQTHLKQEYEKAFGCPVEFNQDCNEIIFKREHLYTPMPRSDVQTSKLCLAQCEKILSEMTRKSTLIEKVREVILSRAGDFPNIIDVSRQLNTSERTLRRKLKEEETSFQAILNDVRSQLAKDYLTTELPIEQIAELVGYSEPANFSSAFKRWTSLSPKEYRQKVL